MNTPRSAPRALTLIEVVAAAALLALLVATCASLLTTVRRSVRPRQPEPPIDVVTLGILAERLAADPVSMGISPDIAAEPRRWPQTLVVPGDGARTTVELHLMEPRAAIEGRMNRAWLVVRCGPTTVCRPLFRSANRASTAGRAERGRASGAFP